MSSIDKVLEFLIRTLKSIRSDGFDSETSAVGREIVHLVEVLVDVFDFEKIILKLSLLPDLLNCLKASSSRQCCLKVISPRLRHLKRPELYSEVIRLFACITRSDLVQLLDGDQSETNLRSVTQDLQVFASLIIDLLPSGNYKQLYDSIESSSSCLNLFILPSLLKYDDLSFCKRIINTGYLGNTSTVLPQRLQLESSEFEWIEPEYTKLMAVKLNLKVIELSSESTSTKEGDNNNIYEFYTEVTTCVCGIYEI